MEYHWIINLQYHSAEDGNSRTYWSAGTVQALPGQTRNSLFMQLLDLNIARIPHAQADDPMVTFFSLEPNQLPQ